MRSILRAVTLLMVVASANVGLATSPTVAAATPIEWQRDFEAAKRIAAQSGRLVLVHFYSTSCPPCAKLEKTVFNQPGFAEALHARYVPVKINADEQPQLAKRFKLDRVPTDIIVTSDDQVLAKLRCPQNPVEYLARLDRVQKPGEPVVASNKLTQAAAAEPTVAWDPRVTTQNSVASGTNDRGMQVVENKFVQPGAVNVAPQQYDAPSQYGPPSGQAINTAPLAVGIQQPFQPVSPQGGQPFSQGVTQSPPPAAQPQSFPIALDGFCPVALQERNGWVAGDRQFGAVHRGRTYLFAGRGEQERFLANPDRYSPVIGGIDPVLALDGRQVVDGKRSHGFMYPPRTGRIYLFANEQSQRQFMTNPTRYAAEAQQAENPRGTTYR